MGRKQEFRLKVFYLTLTFLLMSACLAIWRPLKVSIFAKIVGSEFVPDAKLYGLIFLIPLILFLFKTRRLVKTTPISLCFYIIPCMRRLIILLSFSPPCLWNCKYRYEFNKTCRMVFLFFHGKF